MYQAYSAEIAGPAVAAQRFVLPFKRERMTWIKPSFTWMAHRSGWAHKPGQVRVLGIDILRTGFEWALSHSCITSYDAGLHGNWETWQAMLQEAPVRIQWDPERTIRLDPLPWRTIQVGLRGEAARAYVDEWIAKIEDLTERVHEVEAAVRRGDLERARALVPVEEVYRLPSEIARRVHAAV